MRRAILVALLAAGGIAGDALAQTPAVDVARAQGQIGERYDGYVGVAGTASAGVRSQLARINIQRRSLYTNLAAQKGVSPQDVGITAGCQLLERLGVGQAYLLPDGQWRRRAAGERAAPAYCT